ncbi:MAG: hypothetical protein Q7S64_03075 [bacterium]|nr:hypothetical protein [bacterium]
MIPKTIVWLLITAVSLGLTFSVPLLVSYTVISQLSFWFKATRPYVRWLLVAITLVILVILLFQSSVGLRWLWPFANLLLLLTISTSLIGILGYEQE